MKVRLFPVAAAFMLVLAGAAAANVPVHHDVTRAPSAAPAVEGLHAAMLHQQVAAGLAAEAAPVAVEAQAADAEVIAAASMPGPAAAEAERRIPRAAWLMLAVLFAAYAHAKMREQSDADDQDSMTAAM